ncbi:MAG TPA: ChbG/HpnK family deacetylase [Deltaproteobacteria bacterium]|nr:ChbG/HpnK family deacetylase [Deltaproteobacteria bacterium]
MKGRLVINADDMGLSPEINAGILRGLERDCISDTSVLTGAPHAFTAVDGLKRLGITHAGIHINLDAILGWSPGGHELLPRTVLMDKLEEGTLSGACEEEARHQIDVFLSTGLSLSHLDTHHHVHGFFPVFEIIVRLAGEYRIPCLRFSPNGYRLTTREDIPFDEATYSRMHEQIRGRRLFCCDRCLEGAHRLAEVGPGDTELVVHPSLGGDPWRAGELDTLLRHAGTRSLEADGIRMVSFAELFPATSSGS